MFVAVGSSNAAFGGVSGVDTYCNSSKPSTVPGGDYKGLVMASTRTQNTNWVLQADTEYLNAQGNPVGKTNSSKLLMFSLANPVQASSAFVYTGITFVSDTSWVAGLTCTDWTAGGGSGEVGLSDSLSVTMIANGSGPCASPYGLYCVQQ